MSLLVAIDGPAGSGKSTIAAALAERLGLARLDTGAMYRAVTLLVLRQGVDPENGEAAARLARDMDLDVGDHVRLDGEDVTLAIRSGEVDGAVSEVAAHPAVPGPQSYANRRRSSQGLRPHRPPWFSRFGGFPLAT